MALRKCIRCGWTDESKFNLRDTKRGLLQYVCRDCQQQQGRDRYASNKENVLKINRQSTQKSQARAAIFIQEYLADKFCMDCGESDMAVLTFDHKRAKQFVSDHLSKNPCIDCGENDINVLTFDHVRGKKKDNVTSMVRQGPSIKTIALEIEKTEVVCFNCHMRREQARRGYSRFGRFWST